MAPTASRRSREAAQQCWQREGNGPRPPLTLARSSVRGFKFKRVPARSACREGAPKLLRLHRRSAGPACVCVPQAGPRPAVRPLAKSPQASLHCYTGPAERRKHGQQLQHLAIRDGFFGISSRTSLARARTPQLGIAGSAHPRTASRPQTNNMPQRIMKSCTKRT